MGKDGNKLPLGRTKLGKDRILLSLDTPGMRHASGAAKKK